MAEFLSGWAFVIETDVDNVCLEAVWHHEPTVRMVRLEVSCEDEWTDLFSSVDRLDLFVASAESAMVHKWRNPLHRFARG